MVANIYAFGAAKSDRDTDTNNNRAYSVVQLSQLTIWVTKQLINKSPKFRLPPSRLINSPPPSDNKRATWSPRFLHKLTVVAHPARLQQLHSQPDFNSPPLLFSTNNPSSDHSARRTNAQSPPFVSNSNRHFVVLVLQLHLCPRIPVSEPSSGRKAARTTGEVTPSSSGSVSVIFDRAPEKWGGRLFE